MAELMIADNCGEHKCCLNSTERCNVNCRAWRWHDDEFIKHKVGIGNGYDELLLQHYPDAYKHSKRSFFMQMIVEIWYLVTRNQTKLSLSEDESERMVKENWKPTYDHSDGDVWILDSIHNGWWVRPFAVFKTPTKDRRGYCGVGGAVKGS